MRSIGEVAEYLELRVWPRDGAAVSLLGFEPVPADITGVAEKLAAAGIMPDDSGNYWARDVERSFPGRRGRPRSLAPMYQPDPEETRLQRAGTALPQPWGAITPIIDILHTYLPEEAAASDPTGSALAFVARHVASRKFDKTGEPVAVDPVRSKGFHDRFYLAVNLMLAAQTAIIDGYEAHETRAIARKWIEAHPPRKPD
ncbi:MAG: hypothetical protein Rhirs2KO_12650 [Rhizobiaceae bacterium]